MTTTEINELVLDVVQRVAFSGNDDSLYHIDLALRQWKAVRKAVGCIDQMRSRLEESK